MRELFFWFAVACCMVAQTLIVRSTWQTRARAGVAKTRAGIPASRAGAELAWVVLPALMLALVLALTWRVVRV